nr:hypothetical protein [Faecalibaculum rodentium]
MPTTNFNEYFADQLKDPEFHQQFIEEKAILDSALAISEARHQAGLSQRQLSDRLEFHSLRLQGSNAEKTPVWQLFPKSQVRWEEA